MSLWGWSQVNVVRYSIHFCLVVVQHIGNLNLPQITRTRQLLSSVCRTCPSHCNANCNSEWGLCVIPSELENHLGNPSRLPTIATPVKSRSPGPRRAARLVIRHHCCSLTHNSDTEQKGERELWIWWSCRTWSCVLMPLAVLFGCLD